MQQTDMDVPKTHVVTTRLKPETKAKLRAIAESTKRSEANLAREAIETFVEVNDWQVREIRLALDDARAAEPEVSHERVVEWLKSWGADDELPPPGSGPAIDYTCGR